VTTPVILIVDDEARIREIVRGYLERAGYEVVEAADGQAGLDQAAEHSPNLVVLDLMMPGLDGLEMLRRLREFSQVPVIVLTARAEELDKLIGLAVGADDYVTKPFSPRELVARVKTVLRRAPAAPEDQPDRLRFVDLEIDQAGREVDRSGHPVQLTALEFDLLSALANRPGRVLTRRQLLELVWGVDYFGDERVVDVHIRSLRQALSDAATDPEFIGTVRGVGYKFVARRL